MYIANILANQGSKYIVHISQWNDLPKSTEKYPRTSHEIGQAQSSRTVSLTCKRAKTLICNFVVMLTTSFVRRQYSKSSDIGWNRRISSFPTSTWQWISPPHTSKSKATHQRTNATVTTLSGTIVSIYMQSKSANTAAISWFAFRSGLRIKTILAPSYRK